MCLEMNLLLFFIWLQVRSWEYQGGKQNVEYLNSLLEIKLVKPEILIGGILRKNLDIKVYLRYT